MASGPVELPKRRADPSSSSTATVANKRPCTSPCNASGLSRPNGPPSIQTIIDLPLDAVSSLAKADLRQYFLALQQYAQNPYPLPRVVVAGGSPCSAAPAPPSSSSRAVDLLPSILRLPVEIREQIYLHLLPPPREQPVKGPHPRQLQTHLQLTQLFPPSILLANRQIYHEVIPIFYGAPTQTVSIKIDYNVWIHKTARSPLVLCPAIRSAIKHLHISIHLGCEKRNNRPGDVEKDARISEVLRGVRKTRKWLAEADIQSLLISWQEPSQTYTSDQKRAVLEGLKPLRPKRVCAGEINWGLDWNRSRKFRFPVDYLKELERDYDS